MARCVCGPFDTASCCVMFGRAIGKKIPSFIEILIDQPFAMCDRSVLSFVKVFQKSAIYRQAYASSGATVRCGDPATACPRGWNSRMFHDLGTDVMVAVGAL